MRNFERRKYIPRPAELRPTLYSEHWGVSKPETIQGSIHPLGSPYLRFAALHELHKNPAKSPEELYFSILPNMSQYSADFSRARNSGRGGRRLQLQDSLSACSIPPDFDPWWPQNIELFAERGISNCKRMSEAYFVRLGSQSFAVKPIESHYRRPVLRSEFLVDKSYSSLTHAFSVAVRLQERLYTENLNVQVEKPLAAYVDCAGNKMMVYPDYGALIRSQHSYHDEFGTNIMQQQVEQVFSDYYLADALVHRTQDGRFVLIELEGVRM